MDSKEKKCLCLEQFYSNCYRANPNLLTSGRYIKSLKEHYNKTQSLDTKIKYEYLINRLLQKHIIHLQESIINSLGNTITKRTISNEVATRIFNFKDSYSERRNYYLDNKNDMINNSKQNENNKQNKIKTMKRHSNCNECL